MTNASDPPAPQRRTLRSPTQAAAIVFVLAAVALWLWYPHSPRLVIDAGASAQFAGFTPDGQSVVIFYPKKFIQLWNLHSGRRELSIKADEQEWEPPLEFSTDRKRLSVCRSGGDRGEHDSLGRDYYRVESGEKLSTVHFSRKVKTFVSASPDGLMIACGEYDATLVYDAVTGDLRCQVIGGTAAAFSADGKALAVATKTDAGRWIIKFFDPITGNEQRAFAEGEGIVNSITFSPKGDQLALVVWQDAYGPSETRGIQLWDIASETREQILPMDRDDVANLGHLQFLADGHVISTAGFFRGFAWDLTVPPPNNLVGKTGLTPFPAVLSPDGRLAANLDVYAKEITVRRLGTGTPEIVLRRGATSAYPIGMTPDARLLVSQDPANGGLIWKMAKMFPGLGSRYDVIDITGGRLLGRIPQVAGTGPVGVSPDGRTLVTAEFPPNTPGRFTLWNVPTATPWLAIFGFAALPAVAVGWFFRQRQRSRRETSIE